MELVGGDAWGGGFAGEIRLTGAGERGREMRERGKMWGWRAQPPSPPRVKCGTPPRHY
jgi:hypothetical protein